MGLFIKGDKALGDFLGIKSPHTLAKLRECGLPYRVSKNESLKHSFYYNTKEVEEWMMKNFKKV